MTHRTTQALIEILQTPGLDFSKIPKTVAALDKCKHDLPLPRLVKLKATKETADGQKEAIELEAISLHSIIQAICAHPDFM